MLVGAVERALGLFPVVVVTGARQTGKSTMVRRSAPLNDREYFTLDTAVNRALALHEPRTLLDAARRGPLTIDEIQRVPELLIGIKEHVDTERVPGRYLLTGSANLLLLKSVSESLAGRARYLTLWPMTRREQLGLASCGIWADFFARPRVDWTALIREQTALREPWQALASRGGYPQAALLEPATQFHPDRDELFAGYTQTYLERDLRDLAAIDSLVEFQRLMRAICLRVGTIMNQADLARDTGIARSTLQRYLNLLEVSYQLLRLEPYSVNRTKRLVKSPKVYWSDTGLALHLSGLREARGAHLENLVCMDLHAWRETETSRPAILYWRTSAGDEVDFVIEWQGKLLGIEVKSNRNPGFGDAKGLRVFLDEYRDIALGGLLLHGGDETLWLSEGVLAAPWWKVF